eukprot:1156860-Pelagomonas_calceolata.AAC.16
MNCMGGLLPDCSADQLVTSLRKSTVNPQVQKCKKCCCVARGNQAAWTLTWYMVYIGNLQPDSLADRLLVGHSQPAFARSTIKRLTAKD